MVEHIAYWLTCPNCGAKATDEQGVMITDSNGDRTGLECRECGHAEQVKVKIYEVFEWDAPEREESIATFEE